MNEKNIQQTREKTVTISIPNYTLQNYKEKRVVLTSRSTKRNDSDKNHRKKIFSGLQNLIHESADSRLN